MTSFGLHFSCSSLTGGDWPDLYEQAIQQSQRAEEFGFSHAVVAEHHFTEDGHVPSPIVLSAAIAAATSRIQVGTDILVAPLHHPFKIAEDILVLDNLSRGRAVCGLGMGSSARDFDAYGVPMKQRVSRTEEALEILDKIMTGKPACHAGRYYSFQDLAVSPPPVRTPRPPIYYGGMSQAGARRAARFADAMVIGPNVPLDALPPIRQAYDEQRAALGVHGGAVLLRREAVVAPTRDQAREIGYAALHRQYSTVYRHVPPDLSMNEFAAYAADRFIVGTPDEAIEQIRRFVNATACDTVILRLQMPGLTAEDVMRAVELLGAEVLPAFAAPTLPSGASRPQDSTSVQ